MSISGSGSLLAGIDESSKGGGGAGGGGNGGSGGGKGPEGKDARKAILAGVAAVIGIAAMCIFMFYNFFGQDAGSVSSKRVVIDAETGETIMKFPLPENTAFPYVNPKTGKATLYPAEPCYWTKDGKAKLEPSYVLLNQYKYPEGDKRHNEPTLCPDCGHVVTPHNKTPPSNLFPTN